MRSLNLSEMKIKRQKSEIYCEKKALLKNLSKPIVKILYERYPKDSEFRIFECAELFVDPEFPNKRVV
jgi:hypothetical protein